MRYEGDRIVVLFEEVGYRTLSLDAVAHRGLIKRSGSRATHVRPTWDEPSPHGPTSDNITVPVVRGLAG